MAIHLGNRLDVDLGSEVDLRADLEIQLLEPEQREKFDGILETEHYSIYTRRRPSARCFATS